ncbi:MAG: hypothetical protein ACFFD4_28445 [Candidatus Odinarchaeota archaeon]
MNLTALDLFYGFTTNYHSFHLKGGLSDTTWTHRIMGYFDQLGRMLGYEVLFEHNRYDLTWRDYTEYHLYKKEEPEISLHLEHENQPDFDRITSETLRNKIQASNAAVAVAIAYPNPESMFDNLENWINENKQDFNAKETLIILDGAYIKVDRKPFDVFIINGKIKRKLTKITGISKVLASDNFYCIDWEGGR